jgi:hypothetical protein
LRTKTLLLKILARRAKLKAIYKQLDELEAEVLKRMKPGDTVIVGDQRVTLKDNYAEKNKVFRAHGISRYELDAEPVPPSV